ncbi:hypothetical protein AVT69_gp242 [Pseudomonas phage PhiPA3]|uniref:Uncharacterized protein 244 n=1 Tax=Pseudomonas phage PhiPA3 TaxID=998086 RepID=F8SJ87_BPPA3|nr:hypothetical protein AVT69_gp242 [Pseudomonas phage PhiPA3]AEH03667.1 hypothetical protein [Pseudomonas phage PhiPA3]
MNRSIRDLVDSAKGGNLMSRSSHSKHQWSKEFWSRRPMRYFISCKWAKVKCHRIERMEERKLIHTEMQQL